MKNRQVRLAARPVGMPKRSDWQYTEEAVGAPADGQILVKMQYISLDPAMRGWMNEGKSYIRAGRHRRGDARRRASGEVIASKHPELRGRRSRRRHASACRSTRSPTARA